MIGDLGKEAMLRALAKTAGIDSPRLEGGAWIITKDEAKAIIQSGAFDDAGDIAKFLADTNPDRKTAAIRMF